MPEEQQTGDESASLEGKSSLLGPIRASLAEANESQRYLFLADLMSTLAELVRSSSNGRDAASAEHTAALTRRVQESEKLRADLEDALRAAQADLAVKEKQLEAEQVRVRSLQRGQQDQQAKREAGDRQRAELEAELAARHTDVQRLEAENEQLLIRLQRAEAAAEDRAPLDSLAEGRRQLATQVESLQAELEQLRQEKNAEIERLTAQMLDLQADASQGADTLLAGLWNRLAAARPALTPGGIQPTPQAAERLVEAFIELAGFVQRLDRDMRVFLSAYTKHHPTLGKLWKIYAERDDFVPLFQQTVDPKGGKPVGVLSMKLKFFHKWAFAALVANDSIVASMASELQSHLQGPVGCAADPRAPIRDYLRRSGPELFGEHMVKLRNDKLAELYGFGA
jgi:hypothetical protein